jgi:hypothetical protein
MSTAAAVLGANCLVEELLEGGVPEAKAYAFARLLADVQYPGFNREIAHQDLVTAGYTSWLMRLSKGRCLPCDAAKVCSHVHQGRRMRSTRSVRRAS